MSVPSFGPHPLYAHYVGDTTRYARSCESHVCNRLQVNSIHDVSDEAFIKGLEFFEAHLSKDVVQEQWLSGKPSMNAVYDAARDAQKHYAASEGGNCRSDSWPARLPEQIMHYSSVIDIFVQSHPEYSALAWGAIKFVLIVRLHSSRYVPALLTVARFSWNIPAYSRNSPKR